MRYTVHRMAKKTITNNTNEIENETRNRNQIPFDGPYGTRSEKMACPLSALIEARFTDFTREGKDYPDVSVLDKKFVSGFRPSRVKLL